MKKYTYVEFNRILIANGFEKVRQTGGHSIYKRGENTVSVPTHIEEPISRRLIKENHLCVKKGGKHESQKRDSINIQKRA